MKKTIKEKLKHFGVPNNQWRYALGENYGYNSRWFEGVSFGNEWITIHKGDIAIKAGYAWDGCSPCISVLGLFYIGVPDGAQHLGVPATYHASLVHDALCQWRDEIPITKAASVAVFRELLVKVRFPLAALYGAAVMRLGPQDFYVPRTDQEISGLR